MASAHLSFRSQSKTYTLIHRVLTCKFLTLPRELKRCISMIVFDNVK